MTLCKQDQIAVTSREISREIDKRAITQEVLMLDNLGHKHIKKLYENIDASSFWLQNAGSMLKTPVGSLEKFNRVMESQTLNSAAKMLELRGEIPKINKYIGDLQTVANDLTVNVDFIIENAIPKSTEKGKRLLDLALKLGSDSSALLSSEELSNELFSLTTDMSTLTTITGKSADTLQSKLNSIIDRNMGEETTARVRKMNLTNDKLTSLIIPDMQRSLTQFDKRSSDIKSHN